MMLTALLTACFASLATTMPTASPSPRYFVTFGDSYSQTGFDVTSTKPSASNPLGNPALPGYTASGGYNWVGFTVAQYNASLLLSYNFAYGGATTDASLVTPYEPTVLSFVDQVGEFTEYLAARPSWAPWTGEDTLVGVWLGVNDVGNAFYEANGTAVVEAVVERYFELLQTLYDEGVRNFVLLSVPPTNETPLMLANDAASEALLVASIKQYNSLLASHLTSFRAKNRGVTGWIVDTEKPFYEAIDHPEKYGAPNATCYNSDGTSCLWFNDYHPGIAINRLVAEAVAQTVGKPWFRG